MAQLLRTPKSGSDWTANELCAYNITVVPQNREEFFRTIDFPDPAEPSLVGFMTAETHRDAGNQGTKQLFYYLDMAMPVDPQIGQEMAVVNFAAQLLRDLEYDYGDRVVFIRRGIPFLICGENSVAQTDVCVMDDKDILLLLQDQRLTSMKDPNLKLLQKLLQPLR
jgi:hypothetical protein